MFGVSSGFQPWGLFVPFDGGCLDHDQVVEEFGAVGELVVAVGQTAPELAGGDVVGVDVSRAVSLPESSVVALSANDVGGSGQVKLLFGGEDILAVPGVSLRFPRPGLGRPPPPRASCR
ncbi:hypothetical protein STTU_6098 [Streptomyces sp. Tu6071]|nr:hypothetical protein STTU_6098 [Streptomyces sp. Tu6071]